MRKFIFTIVLLLSVFPAACAQTSGETEEIKQVIESALEISPYIPDEGSIETVILNHHHTLGENNEPEKGDPFNVEIEYKASTDEKLDEALKEEWEQRDPLKEIIYGNLYMDPNKYKVTIFKDGAPEIQNAESIEIEGHKVQYQYIDRAGETAIMAMDFKEYGYMIEFYLKDEQTEGDAQAFAEDIIRNVK